MRQRTESKVKESKVERFKRRRRGSMEAARRFEDLWVWQQARELVKEIYQDFHTAGGARDFGFRDQIQRAAVPS